MSLSSGDKQILKDVANWFRRNRNNLSNIAKNTPSRMVTAKQRIKIGKPDADIAINTTGTISIWRDGADTGENIDAVLDWMHGGEQVSLGKEVVIEYFADEDVWRITGAECED